MRSERTTTKPMTSNHAKKRCRQRAIPEAIAQIVSIIGRREYKNDSIYHFLKSDDAEVVASKIRELVK